MAGHLECSDKSSLWLIEPEEIGGYLLSQILTLVSGSSTVGSLQTPAYTGGSDTPVTGVTPPPHEESLWVLS